jgi:hypothetical protein
MQLVTPSAIQHVAWEGTLEPVEGAAVKALALTPLPLVTIGEPVAWDAAQALEVQTGQHWSPPLGGPDGPRHYTLVRLDCTLHPPQDAYAHMRYSEATLTAYLRPRDGVRPVIAYDVYPQRITATDTQNLSLKLGPDLKFGPVNVNLAEVKVDIQHHNTFPVIQAYGLGESKPYWQFATHATRPLLGCQSVYMVMAAPQDAHGVRVLVELIATLETRFGPLRLGLPQSASAHVSRLLGG